MHATDFGRTLIIANPAAQSGAAREVAERLQRFLDMTARASQFDLVLTECMGHAKELAAQAQGYRTVIALGGDGVIHEVLNGLMAQKEDARPALAILPVGSGNDFAQTLGIENFSGKDFGALLTCELQRQDIGRIRSWNPASGSGEACVEYYDQTLSVGIDAAIGLGTTELRKKTGLTGAPLYTLSGLEQFGLRYRNYPMTVSFDGAPAERVRAIIMAIQLGPTYGSGYRICPDATRATACSTFATPAAPFRARSRFPCSFRPRTATIPSCRRFACAAAAMPSLLLRSPTTPSRPTANLLSPRASKSTSYPAPSKSGVQPANHP